jgi:hypothetical protein
LSNTPAGRKRIRNIPVPPRRMAKSQMNTQMSRPRLGRSPIYGNGPVETFNFQKAKKKCIIFEDSHPFKKDINLKELFPNSKKTIIAKKKQITYSKCQNVQQLFVMLCLSSIAKKLGGCDYALMPAVEWERREGKVKDLNQEMNFNCNAYFVDLDGLNPTSIIRRHESDNVMRTQMAKLQHIQDILKVTSNNNIIVGFIQANAESVEYLCLRPEVVKSGEALDNLMVTSIGLNQKQHREIVEWGWFRKKQKKLLKKMKGKLYLDVSKEFKEDCDHDIAVSIYIRKQKETDSGLKGKKLDQICEPISNQSEALLAFENGMKITRVKWLQRNAGHKTTVQLDSKPFDWDYLSILRKDSSFLSALNRIYQNKEA